MSTARWIIGFVGVLGVGGLIVDYLVWETARQHIKNPAWPPHAKFHNAQTILLGLGLGALSLVLVCVPSGANFSQLLVAGCTASMYWLSMLFAPVFPGTAWSDPEFRPIMRPVLGLQPQQLLALCIIALDITGLGIGILGSAITHP